VIRFSSGAIQGVHLLERGNRATCHDRLNLKRSQNHKLLEKSSYPGRIVAMRAVMVIKNPTAKTRKGSINAKPGRS
jgi:hypothetical protein